MSFVAHLYNTVKPARPAPRAPPAARPSLEDDTFQIEAAGLGLGNSVEERRRREEQERKEDKRRAKEAKDAEKRKRQEEEQRKKAQGKVKRKAFNYEEVRPHISRALQHLIVFGIAGKTSDLNCHCQRQYCGQQSC